MESQQIVDYIRQQLAAGHTEARLRQHLLGSGWTQPQVEAAFTQYRTATSTGKTTKKSKRASKISKPRRKRTRVSTWTWPRRLALVGGAVVVAVVSFGIYKLTGGGEPEPEKPAAPHYTYQQKQAIDVNTVGTVIGQYSVSTGEVPLSATIGADGNLILCGTVCDPALGEVVTLIQYKPTDVKFAAFKADLTAPDSHTMYIVPQATCKDKGKEIDASTRPRAVVILYSQASSESGDLTHRCVVL
jgi:hypothetical protein